MKRGFTLIELLVVTALILVIIASVTQLFFSALRGATKTTLTNETRQSGDYAISVMERMIRNATTIEDIDTYCDGSTKSSIIIKNPDTGTTFFQCPTDSTIVRIASNSASVTNPTPVPGYLTSDKIAVDSYPGCSFSCTRNSSDPAVVNIQFTIHQLTPIAGVTLRPEEKNSINFETSVVVRNTGL